MRGRSLTRFASGLVSLLLFAWCAGGETHSGGGPVRPGAARGVAPAGSLQDGVFESLEQALRSPERVRRLVLQSEDPRMRRLPPGLGAMINLEALEMSCLENLRELPEEIGGLRKLQELIIDNGNGCSMNVTLPRSLGRLENLRVLRLYGALDAREVGAGGPTRAPRGKALPASLADLRRLEELDLGRNGIRSLPPQVASLRRLKKLGLDYNDIRELPSFVGGLTRLEELSLNSNGGVALPQSLAALKGLRLFMGNNRLTLREQQRLRARFPHAVFSFENEFDDDAANEQPRGPRARPRRGRTR